MRFITDYLNINHKLVIKTYPLPRIVYTVQKLEGLQYATSLYINMGYYTIRLYPDRQDMETIVTEFGKFRYSRLPIGMCTSREIFQAKVDNILGDIEGIKTYIDDILVLSKDIFENHIEQLIIIFSRLCAAGLKGDAPNCSFGLKEIPYLGYVITMEVIRTDPKKVQGVMDLRRPATTTEEKLLIVMV